MRRFIIRRLLLIVLVLFLVSLIVFFITSVIPGDTAQAILGHAKADVTQVYAERNLAKAHVIMAEIG